MRISIKELQFFLDLVQSYREANNYSPRKVLADPINKWELDTSLFRRPDVDNIKTRAKKAKTYEEAYKAVEEYRGLPHGEVRWGNSEVCMDIYCKCGANLIANSDSLFSVKCPKCETFYLVSPYVELVEIEEEGTVFKAFIAKGGDE